MKEVKLSGKNNPGAEQQQEDDNTVHIELTRNGGCGLRFPRKLNKRIGKKKDLTTFAQDFSGIF